MNPPWGINWQRYHADRQDMPHIERMGYRSFTIYEWMWSNRDFCNELISVARQDAIFLNRDHPLSEQKDDEWKRDPAAKGRKHADEWAQKVREGRVYTPLDRTYFLGLNEPDSNNYPRQIDAYNEAYCRRMAEHGLRAAAYSFGVGHPATVNLLPNTKPNWTPYAASAMAVLEGHHIAAMHEYGAPDGYGWGYWCNRLEHCPYPFGVVLDECGIDYGVVKAGELYGWARFMTPEEYLRWLDGFQLGMAERAHTRQAKILAYNIFGYDHGRGDNKDRHSFDIRPLRGLIEDYAWSVPTVAPSPAQHNAYLPHVGNQESNSNSGSNPQLAPEVEPPKKNAMSSNSGAIDPLVLEAIIKVESGGQAYGPDGRLLIRFEAHIFLARQGHNRFRHNTDKPWTGQQVLLDGWRDIHTGSQEDEYNAFEIARAANARVAYESISVGLGQIMGFNHERIGYPSAEAMYNAFARSEAAQVIGLINFFLSDPQLTQAARSKDWRTIARLYNGPGDVDRVAPLLQRTYEGLRNA